MSDDDSSCPQCGARVPSGHGESHAYIGATPGCWQLYGEVLAREYSDARFAGMHRMTVDAYAVQHPGRPERRSIQSVAVHLIGLHIALEREMPADVHASVLRAAAGHSATFRWLEPPPSPGAVTVRDVHSVGDDPQAHQRVVRAWAESTWAAWAPHHAQVREWAAASMASRTGMVGGRY